MIETTSEYMARKGLALGEPIVGAPTPAAALETQLEYMARKGLQPGDEITSSPAEAGRVVYESQLDYLARKAAEAEATPPEPVKKGKGE